MTLKTSSPPSNRFEFLQDDSLREVMSVLAPYGGAYVVGGAVRNSLMGIDPKDVDISTPVPPEEAERLFLERGYKVIRTGIEHGTITVISGGVPYEITTFRKEVALGTGPGGRSAAVTWAKTIEEDAVRRDLTMNALYVDIDGNLIDVVGGTEDIRNGVVRFVGDPTERLEEDRLRALRFFRFWANYGDPDPKTHSDAISAIKGFVGRFSVVSKERIGAEMRNLLSAKRPENPIRVLTDIGLLSEIAPSVSPERLMTAISRPDLTKGDFLTVLAHCAKENIKDDWKLSNAEARVISLIQGARREGCDVKRGYEFGEEIAACGGALRVLDGLETPDADKVKHGAESFFPLKASDFPDLSGKRLGLALKAAKQAWLSGGAIADKAGLLGEQTVESELGM